MPGRLFSVKFSADCDKKTVRYNLHVEIFKDYEKDILNDQMELGYVREGVFPKGLRVCRQ